MRIIDTHSHVYDEVFNDDFEAMLQRAFDIGVDKILMPNIDEASVEAMHRCALAHPNKLFPMMGLHPTSVQDDWNIQLDRMKQQFRASGLRYVAVGEIGLDYYWDTTYKAQQLDAFEQQLLWSAEEDLPVVIHTRNAFDDAVSVVKSVMQSKPLRGVFHSFGGSQDDLQTILSLDTFYIGINGVVTFKNAKLEDVVDKCSLQKLLVETDAPYLAPVPHRGKRNEPANLFHILSKLSDIFQKPHEQIAEITAQNAERLFAL